MTDASSPGQLPVPSTTAAPGWYPDPADPRYNRWWDGSAWTAHVGPPASQLMAQRPPISASTPVYNAFIWIIAGLPLIPAIALLAWNPEMRFYTSRTGNVVPDPSSLFGLGYFLILGSSLLAYAGSVVLAYFDFKRLLRSGVVRPFHWAWAFAYFGGAIYVVGRAIVVNKVAAGRGWWPIGVLFAAWMAIITVGSYKNMVWMQSIFSGIGYGS